MNLQPRLEPAHLVSPHDFVLCVIGSRPVEDSKRRLGTGRASLRSRSIHGDNFSPRMLLMLMVMVLL